MKKTFIIYVLVMVLAMAAVLSACTKPGDDITIDPDSDYDTYNATTAAPETTAPSPYSRYKKDFEIFQERLNLPDAYLNNADVLELFKSKVDMSNSKNPIAFDSKGSLFYTADRKICYKRDSNELQIVTKNSDGLSIKKTFNITYSGTVDDEPVYDGFIWTETAYDGNLKSIKYNHFDEYGIGAGELKPKNYNKVYIFGNSTDLDGTLQHKYIHTTFSKGYYDCFLYRYDDPERYTLYVNSVIGETPESYEPKDKTIDNADKDLVEAFYNMFDKHDLDRIDDFVFDLLEISVTIGYYE